MKNRKFTVQDMVIVGLMAALVYAVTLFRIEIPTPTGKIMLHMATVVCLLSGLLFGPVRGGLAAGIGSFLFDILNGWASSAPFTLIFKFIMGFLAGLITGGRPQKAPRTFLACAVVAYTYSVLYLSKSFLRDMLMGAAMETAMADMAIKIPTSLGSNTIGFIVAGLLAPVLRLALKRAGLRLQPSGR